VPHLAALEFQISPVCGKLMVSYGLAGLLAPWLTGILYVGTGGYAAAFGVGASHVLAALIGFTMTPQVLRSP
jgi:MFS transporter, OFA family, oxalate/formate antiporter